MYAPKPATAHIANRPTVEQTAHDVWGLTIEL